MCKKKKPHGMHAYTCCKALVIFTENANASEKAGPYNPCMRTHVARHYIIIFTENVNASEKAGPSNLCVLGFRMVNIVQC